MDYTPLFPNATAMQARWPSFDDESVYAFAEYLRATICRIKNRVEELRQIMYQCTGPEDHLEQWFVDTEGLNPLPSDEDMYRFSAPTVLTAHPNMQAKIRAFVEKLDRDMPQLVKRAKEFREFEQTYGYSAAMENIESWCSQVLKWYKEIRELRRKYLNSYNEPGGW